MGTLANGIKDIFSTNQTTATHLPVCASDGTPQGRISVGDLASVLGAPNIVWNKVVDFDNPKSGFFCYGVNSIDLWSNIPLVVMSPAICISNCRSDIARGVQLIVDSAGVIWTRRWENTWTTWSRSDQSAIPSFYKNYANLNALTNDLVKQNALSIGNVMVVTNVDSYTRFWPADRALESGIASIAVGAGIIENGRTLIIAKDAANKQWATSNVTGGTTAISDRRAAIADFDGRAKTTTILATLGDNAPAAKYCNEYYPSNVASSDTNMGTGRWWLPSLGEWAMIWAHVREVNFVLAAIGGTQIPVGSGWTWSSTEGSAAYAWALRFNTGGFDTNYKPSEGSVRPVSAFY